MASPMFWFVLFAVLPLTFELFSWALGKWYQGRLIAALDVREKQEGSVLENESIVSTANQMTRMGAASSTLLHVSICVGPSIGQVFFMWIKSILVGDNNPTMSCLTTAVGKSFTVSNSKQKRLIAPVSSMFESKPLLSQPPGTMKTRRLPLNSWHSPQACAREPHSHSS